MCELGTQQNRETLVSTEHYPNRDPREMNDLAGILCNGDFILKNRESEKTKKVMSAPFFLS